ncbi:MAG: hypothetical protein M3Q07_04970, partial [Pseudobdellovibrionaceae bacterium]|nr:hypothetical protein [Pseudobdellovibrionaceae bacterium]
LYEQHGTRPEFARGEGTPFLAKLGEFLRDFAQPGHLQTLTSFSLPAGREPAHLDEWVFLSFKGEKGKIMPLPIAIHSKKDGRKLLSLTSSMRGTMARDDEALYEPFADEVAEELKETVMLRVPDIRRLASILQDRKQILVPNTSCISCHKMNSERFDFHNLSYLEDRDISISPRVKRDVELDRSWITDFLSDD